ncbi:MAG: cation:proton antiporter, partial [Thaumarchaeota archaeon]|nr:cation:proton antiporter [Nitrososphaerota archaeon]
MASEILYLALLILLAKLFEEVAARFRQPSLLGYVLAGLVLGPVGLSIVKPIPEIRLFINIGVFFLFFLTGFEEIDIPGLLSVLRRKLFLAAFVGFLLPFGLSYVFLDFFKIPTLQAIALAAVFSVSSLGVVVKSLSDLGRLKDPAGLEVFSITAISEFVGLLIASASIQLATGTGGSFQDLLLLPIRIIVFFVLAGLLGVTVVPRVLDLSRKYMRVKQISLGLLVAILLLFVYFAEISGVHGAIGALLLGIALSPLSKEVHFEITRGFHTLAYGVFVPIFFAGVGLFFQPSFLNLSPTLIAGILGIMILGRFGGAYLSTKVLRLSSPLALSSGLLSKGAVDLALMLTLFDLGLATEELFAVYTLGIIIIVILSPALLKYSFGKSSPPSVAEAKEALIPLYTRMVLSDVKAKDVVLPGLVAISEDTVVSDFVQTHLKTGRSSYIIIDENNRLRGSVSIKEIKKVPKRRWSSVTIGSVMRRDISPVF